MQVDGARVDGRERALGLDRADQLAGAARRRRRPSRRGRAQRDLARPGSRAARQVAAVATAAQLALTDQPSARSRQSSPRISSSSAPGVGRCRRAAARRRRRAGGASWIRSFSWSRIAASTGRLEELLGVAAEELVERVLAGDVERESLAAPPGAPPHLAQAGDGAREGDADRRVELADVDAELERVGGDHREQLAAREPRLDLAPLLRRVAGPVRGDPLGELGSPELLEPHPREPLDQLDRRARLRRKQIVRDAVDHQVGEQLGGLGEHRAPASSSAGRSPAGSRSRSAGRARGAPSESTS